MVGDEDWPFPVPLVKKDNTWAFDAKAGRQELLYRRIGANELDAIQICHGYVEAQYEYALQPREGYNVNQYAQRIISSPGKQDGLAGRIQMEARMVPSVNALHMRSKRATTCVRSRITDIFSKF